MLQVDVFSDFISVGARSGISKYGSAILGNEDFAHGMSGYDVQELVEFVIDKHDKELFTHFEFDSEYGMFCMYYKHNGSYKIAEMDYLIIAKCTELVTKINHFIALEYIHAVSDFNTKPIVTDYRKK